MPAAADSYNGMDGLHWQRGIECASLRSARKQSTHSRRLALDALFRPRPPTLNFQVCKSQQRVVPLIKLCFDGSVQKSVLILGCVSPTCPTWPDRETKHTGSILKGHLTLLPTCLHFGLIYSAKFMQPPLLSLPLLV